VTQNPLWNVSLRSEFFRCHTVEFHVYHYRSVGFNTKVGVASISVLELQPGEPVTIPIQMLFPCSVQPTICFSFLPQWIPFPVIREKRGHKRLFVYTTYSPPIESPTAPFPVSFKCLAVDDVEGRFSVLDETVDWQLVGKGCLGHLSPGPTGPTYVGMLNRKKLKRVRVTFILCSANYTGNVTLNFVMSEVEWHSGIYRKLPDPNTVGILHQICVPVRPCFVGTIPFAVRVKKSHFLFEPIEPVLLEQFETPGAFEAQIALILLGKQCVRRLLQPQFESWTIQRMAAVHGIPPPDW
jgi:hypothetical protein